MTDDSPQAPPPKFEEERDSVRNDTPSPPVPNETNGAVDVDAAHDRAS